MSPDDNPLLFQILTRASRIIDRYCKERRFYPRSKTRDMDYQKARTLLLDDDLLEITTLTAGGTAVSSSDYFLYPLNDYPKRKIEIDRSKSALFNYSATLQSAIAIAATWGWHDDWDNAWPDSQDEVEDDPLSSSATTLTVNDVDGADVDGITPRFSAGQLLKIEDEYMAVTDSDINVNTLTVRRGVNGTTAAEHAQDETIYIYRPPEIITSATLALAKMQYELRSAVGGIIALPSLEGGAIRAKVTELLDNYALPRKLVRLR